MLRLVTTLFVLSLVNGCDSKDVGQGPSLAMALRPDLDPRAAKGNSRNGTDAGPIRIELFDEKDELPVFVMRGAPRGAGRLVFLHGMCGHGLGYAQSFQYSASKKGTLIAPQGDVSCGGIWSKWSLDVAQLDARIVDTFRGLGHKDPIDDIVVIGMSQGATRAEELARKYPQRYTRLISMAAPTAIKPGDLKQLRGAVLMAGERDRQDLMQASTRALKASRVPAEFMVIPDATHGAMGPTPEQTMGSALDWLWENSKETTADNGHVEKPSEAVSGS